MRVTRQRVTGRWEVRDDDGKLISTHNTIYEARTAAKTTRVKCWKVTEYDGWGHVVRTARIDAATGREAIEASGFDPMSTRAGVMKVKPGDDDSLSFDTMAAERSERAKRHERNRKALAEANAAIPADETWAQRRRRILPTPNNDKGSK